MHEASLSDSVLAVLRRHPGPYLRIRVHVANPGTPVEELTQILRTHLATADPPVDATGVEVVALPRARVCASCGQAWVSADPAPGCPHCGGPPLPLRHDHTIEVELIG